MKNNFIIGLILCALIFSPRAFCDPNRDEASFGTTFALTTFGYGFCKKVLRMKPIPAFIFASLGAMALGVSSDLMNFRNTDQQLIDSLIWRKVGTLSAGATFVIFSF